MPFNILAAGSADIAPLFIELGVIFLSLALAARICNIIGLSPIPIFLLIGMGFGAEGILPVEFSEEFISAGAEIGVLLLLFALGLEYTAPELGASLRTGFRAGVLDIVLNFTPGFVVGLLLEWDLVVAMLLGGVTYISSSGIISKLLSDLGWLGNRSSPAVLSMLVFEDLVMAIYLPLMTVLLIGDEISAAVVSLAIAGITVVVITAGALLLGERVSKLLVDRSNEIILLSALGFILLVGGVAQNFQVSGAVGAFLVGIAFSRQLSEKAHHIMEPVRDLFAAVFFVFFGLQISPSELPPVMLLALGMGVVTAITKMITGIYAARRLGVSVRGQVRAGTLLTIRGEFSIVIAGLAASAGVVEPQLAPLAAAYVLLMAIVGPISLRFLDPILNFLLKPRGKSVKQDTVSADTKA